MMAVNARTRMIFSMRRILQLVGFLSILFAAVEASAACTGASPTWTTTPDRASVQTCVSGASNGDTVNVTAGDGSETWATQVSITKGISLIGPGDTNLTIVDGMTTGQAMLSWTCVQGYAHRLSGFRFEDGGAGTNAGNGVFAINCTNVGDTTFRIDHNISFKLDGFHFFMQGVVGLIDHNEFYWEGTNRPFYITHGAWNGVGNEDWGDGSWAASIDHTNDTEWLYIEDNLFQKTNLGASTGAFDGRAGMRTVARFNRFINTHYVTHGTDSSGRKRGGLFQEIYGNSFDLQDGNSIAFNIRSGSSFFWGNTVTNLSGSGRFIDVDNDRGFHEFEPWEPANATSNTKWDVIDGGSPFAVCPGPSTTCTVGSYNSSNRTITVSGAAFAPSALVGYTIVKTNPDACAGSDPPISAANCYSLISANTATTISFSSNFFGGSSTFLTFTAGQEFQIRKITRYLDGVGIGGGSLLAGGAALPAAPPTTCGGVACDPTGTSGTPWNDQVVTPLYIALNTLDGVATTTQSQNWGGGVGSVVEGTHVYSYAGAYVAQTEQTSGVLSGTEANRAAITTCTAGVGFLVSNHSSNWNPGTNSLWTADSALYVCGASNNWVLTHQPVVYPHPLSSDTDPGLNLGGISPNFGAQNAATMVTLTGTGFRGTDNCVSTVVNVSKSGGSGLSAGAATCVSDASITVTLTATAGATTGIWSVTVTTDEGTSNPVDFTVNASAGPSLTTIDPSSCSRGTTCPVTLTGTQFTGGNGTITEACTGIAFNTIVVVGATSITANAVVDADAPLTLCEVAVTTDAGTSNTREFQPLSVGVGPRGALTMRGGR